MEETIFVDPWDEYVKYLFNELNGPSQNNDYSINFYRFFKDLGEIEFNMTYRPLEDQQRVDDGLLKRKVFCRQRLWSVDILSNHPVSVLEVLVAFAIRIEKEYVGDPFNYNPWNIFYEFFINMGISYFIEKNYKKYRSFIFEKVEDFVHREYDRDGKGGIFWIDGTHRDQRLLPLWEQMLEYITTYYN